MEEKIDEINESMNLGETHHSLHLNIARAAIQALGSGSSNYRLGSDEGQICFQHEGSSNWYVNEVDTTLVSGADGTTNYLKVKATFTAPQATVIEKVNLVGTKDGRTSYQLFSDKTVNQSLEEGQSYTVYWTIHADI